MKVGKLLLREFETIAMLSDDKNDNNDNKMRHIYRGSMTCHAPLLFYKLTEYLCNNSFGTIELA